MKKNKVLTVIQFIGIVFIIVLISIIVAMLLWLNAAKNASFTPEPSNPLGEYKEETLIDIPRHTNVMIAGVDAETGLLTDFMMVGSYDSDTGELDFISIPRDTDCTLNEEQRAIAKSEGLSIPKTIKLNALHSYTKSTGMDFLTMYIEDLLGIEIQYQVLVDLNVLHDVITAMGGVWFDVPQRMYYNDNAQNLHIDLQPGYQLLDADQCEQLLRYRHGYARGDLQRIEVQQQFLDEMLTQLLSLGTFMSNPVEFITAVSKNVETNATALDVARYVPEIPKLSPSNFSFQTAPIASVGNYVELDELKLAQLVDKIFYDIEPITPETSIDGGNADGTTQTGTTTTPK